MTVGELRKYLADFKDEDEVKVSSVPQTVILAVPKVFEEPKPVV